jgi:hypothetical protein
MTVPAPILTDGGQVLLDDFLAPKGGFEEGFARNFLVANSTSARARGKQEKLGQIFTLERKRF